MLTFRFFLDAYFHCMKKGIDPSLIVQDGKVWRIKDSHNAAQVP